MAKPQLVADCVAAMRRTAAIPVTVKCRIGIDDQDDDRDLDNFVSTVAQTGCTTFIVHARKAWLDGLSPKENREIPPLNYERVYRLKKHRPKLTIVINGGIASLEEAINHLKHVDGVMLGRAAYHTPWLLSEADQLISGDPPSSLTRRDVVGRMMDYAEEELAKGTYLSHIARHMLGLYHGQPNGRLWRRILSEGAHRPGAGIDLLERALETVEGRPSRLAAAE